MSQATFSLLASCATAARVTERDVYAESHGVAPAPLQPPDQYRWGGGQEVRQVKLPSQLTESDKTDD